MPPERAEPELQVDAELTRLTNPAVASQVAEAAAAMNAATTAAELHSAYAKAIVASDALTEWAQSVEMGEDLDPITSRAPGITMGWFAEGTAAVFYLDPDDWKAKAATTTGTDDDTYFELVDYVYSQGNPDGWAVWQMRNWDYGGCSGLGKGVVLESLQKAQAAKQAGPAFSEEVAQVRASAIEEITRTGENLFPRCDVDTMQPMSDDALRSEVQSVLDTIDLTDAEREALVAIQPKLVGQEFEGG